jgi:hypothetical protein
MSNILDVESWPGFLYRLLRSTSNKPESAPPVKMALNMDLKVLAVSGFPPLSADSKRQKTNVFNGLLNSMEPTGTQPPELSPLSSEDADKKPETLVCTQTRPQTRC